MLSEKISLAGRKTTLCRWPVKDRRAKLLIVHGLGEHIARYDAISKEFNAAGIEMVGFDQRGHGENPGRKGHVNSFDELLSDLDLFVEEEKCEVPLFMLGHSLGGLIAARYVEEHPDKLKGVVLSSGAFSSDNISGFLKFIANFFSVLFPTVAFSNGIDVKYLSRNPKIVEDYQKDPLVHNKITARLASEIFKNTDVVFRNAKSFTTPVLFVAGSEDRVVPHEGTKKLFSSVSSKDKKMIIFDGGYHEIFCDPELSDKFRKTIVDWIVERLDKN